LSTENIVFNCDNRFGGQFDLV